MLRKLGTHDLETLKQVARLHVENLDQSFLATLGSSFLTLMYQAIDECESSVLLVESSGSRVNGFVSGTESMGRIYRGMLRYWPRLVTSLFPSILNPMKVWRILEILSHSRQKNKNQSLPSFELLSIAVDPDYRGQGAAERLYRALVGHCRGLKKPAFKIIVGERLLPAHRFYRKMGAVQAGEVYVHGGQRSIMYVQSTITDEIDS
jgi:ribosomal protein S18 acetylase RimI-like enzyme